MNDIERRAAFGRAIKGVRLLQGLTLREAWRLFGFDLVQWSRVERGLRADQEENVLDKVPDIVLRMREPDDEQPRAGAGRPKES